jgi:uncharacterized protein YkwD
MALAGTEGPYVSGQMSYPSGRRSRFIGTDSDQPAVLAAQTAPLRQSLAHTRPAPIAAALFAVVATLVLVGAIPANATTSRYLHSTHSGPLARPASTICPNADVEIRNTSYRQLRGAVVCLVNWVRVAEGLPALHVSSSLNHSAQRWANAMVARDIFRHGNVAARVSATGFTWSTLGENIATGFSIPRQLVLGWLQSPDHCRNILAPIYAYVGTGVNRGFVRGWANQGGTWAEDFGLPVGGRAPSDNWVPASRCPY